MRKHYWHCQNPDCIVCRDYREEYEAKARPYLIQRRLNNWLESESNHTLDDYDT